MIEPKAKVKQGSWGAFMQYAAPFGVTLEESHNVELPNGNTGSIKYLRRDVSGETLTYPLPEGFSMERPLMFLSVEKVCERLRIKFPIGWAIIL